MKTQRVQQNSPVRELEPQFIQNMQLWAKKIQSELAIKDTYEPASSAVKTPKFPQEKL